MEKKSDVVVATERYGSTGFWKYVAKNGIIERRRDESESVGRRGNPVVGVFKVRVDHTFFLSSDPTWVLTLEIYPVVTARCRAKSIKRSNNIYYILSASCKDQDPWCELICKLYSCSTRFPIKLVCAMCTHVVILKDIFTLKKLVYSKKRCVLIFQFSQTSIISIYYTPAQSNRSKVTYKRRPLTTSSCWCMLVNLWSMCDSFFLTYWISACVSASRLPRECQWWLSAVSVLGHCSGTVEENTWFDDHYFITITASHSPLFLLRLSPALCQGRWPLRPLSEESVLETKRPPLLQPHSPGYLKVLRKTNQNVIKIHPLLLK